MPPISSEAFCGNALTASTSLKLHGTIKALSPKSSASAFNGSIRVPDNATFAPCAYNALAIDPPIPPDAPVINAHLPSNSNISIPLFEL